MDLCAITSAGATLYKNAGGQFAQHAATLPAGSYRKAVWLDYDHDYDLDLFLLGKTAALVRNNGQAGFAELTSAFPFVPGMATDGVRIDVIADTGHGPGRGICRPARGALSRPAGRDMRQCRWQCYQQG